jgi:membrane-associated protein
MSFNVAGGILWVVSLTLAGFLFGGLAFVQNNFSTVIFGIIIISLLPGIFEFVRERRRTKKL